MLKHVLLDLHDTLIYEKIFHEKAENKLCEYIKNFGIEQEAILQTFKKVDLNLMPSMGCSSKRVIKAFEKTLTSLVPNATKKDLETVASYAKEIYMTTPKLKPGVKRAVKLLSRYFPTILVTSGTDADRIEKQINDLPFKDEFSDVIIVDEKNTNVFEEIIQKTGCKPEELVMIGNSRKSDINPAAEAHMQSVYIDSESSTHISNYMNITTLPRNSYEFTTILEAAQHIVTYKTAAPLPEVLK